MNTPPPPWDPNQDSPDYRRSYAAGYRVGPCIATFLITVVVVLLLFAVEW